MNRLMVSVYLITTIALLGCCAENLKEDYMSDGGFDNRLKWEALNAVIGNGEALLESPDGSLPSMIRQRTRRLRQNRMYRLSVTAKALTMPLSNLSVDLFLNEAYDNPAQELVVKPASIVGSYETFYLNINSGTFDEPPSLRLFTFSAVPIVVDEVSIVELSH